MRLGVDITVIAKLLQFDYATIILYCKQTSIKTNLLLRLKMKDLYLLDYDRICTQKKESRSIIGQLQF